KDALCQLSYIGLRAFGASADTSADLCCECGLPTVARRSVSGGGQRLERETGIEPATNSLEGCDSTTELLPPTRRARPPAPPPLGGHPPSAPPRPAPPPPAAPRHFSDRPPPPPPLVRGGWPAIRSPPPPPRVVRAATAGERWWRGKDSNLRSR